MPLKKKAPVMQWYGLTGSIGSGKSAVAEILRERGVAVVDADELARYVVRPGEPVLREIAQTFGQDVVSKDGQLNREKLGQIVFNDQALRSHLESLLHPLIRAEAERRRNELNALGQPLAFNDVPLLFEKNMKALFDGVVVVNCSPENQVLRLMARNKIGRAEAEKRIALQMPLSAKIKLADYVIENDGPLEDLEKNVTSLLAMLKSKLRGT